MFIGANVNLVSKCQHFCLNRFGLRRFVHANIDETEEKLNNFGRTVRDIFQCSVVVGDVSRSQKDCLVKINKVAEKMKQTTLVIVKSEMNSDLENVIFKTKTLIITGNYIIDNFFSEL
jgi:hypothetical protein